MKVTAVNPEKFRIRSMYIEPSGIYCGSKDGYIREYQNPEAEDWFIKAQRANSIEERKTCFEKMGEYRLIDLDEEKKFNRTFNKWNLLKMRLKDSVRKFEGKINGLFR